MAITNHVFLYKKRGTELNLSQCFLIEGGSDAI